MTTQDTFYDLDDIKSQQKKAEFSIQNIDVSIVNSIRRTIQSHVKNIAFFFDAKSIENPDIEIIQNDSPLHNEFLSQRLSMIPIHFEKKIIDDWNRDHYSFVIDEKNNSNKFMDITSKHIKVYINDVEYKDRDNIFPPYITPEKAKDFILITKLPPATTKFSPAIKVNLKASLGSGHQHSCFSPTSLCTYMNKIIEGPDLQNAEEKFIDQYLKQYEPASNVVDDKAEKDDEAKAKEMAYLRKQAKLKFNTLDKQREYYKNTHGEPNKFVFKLESECALLPSELFSDAIKYLLSRIEKLVSSNIVVNDLGDNHFEIMIYDESHTVGNLIQALVYNKFIRENMGEKISFIGYFVTHPLENTVCMKVTSSLKKDEVLKFFKEEALEHVEVSLKKLLKEWENVE